MTHGEMKRKTYALIEELNPGSEYLTDDPDIQVKYNSVANQILFELARIKKIPRYIEMEVASGELVSFDDIEKNCGNVIYQLGIVRGVDFLFRANGTVLKILESGTLEIDCFVYPERITEKTGDNYEFELSDDALEIMPYGIAGDLLKNDESAEFGSAYSARYESMLGRLDPRYKQSGLIYEGGWRF